MWAVQVRGQCLKWDRTRPNLARGLGVQRIRHLNRVISDRPKDPQIIIRAPLIGETQSSVEFGSVCTHLNLSLKRGSSRPRGDCDTS